MLPTEEAEYLESKLVMNSEIYIRTTRHSTKFFTVRGIIGKRKKGVHLLLKLLYFGIHYQISSKTAQMLYLLKELINIVVSNLLM